jgi:hypothetical protein
MLHALTLKLFYRLGLDSCLEVEAKSVLFGTQLEGLRDMPYRMRATHQRRQAQARPHALPLSGRGRHAALSGLGVIADNLVNIGQALHKRTA